MARSTTGDAGRGIAAPSTKASRRQESRTTGRAGRAIASGRNLYLRVRTRAEPLETQRLEAGVQCRRPRALTLALLLFVAGMTLDDLRVLRWPAYAVGSGLAILVIAFGPLAMGRALAATYKSDSLAEFQARASRLRRLELLGLLVVVLVTVVWLSVFSSGVPPWAR